jgi:hypothetical protein
MCGDDEKEGSFGDWNAVFDSQWSCSVGITFREKTFGWSLSRARWPRKVELHPIVVVVVVVVEVVAVVVVVVVVGGSGWVTMTRRRT